MLKVLYIGNSFSCDILEHSVSIAQNLGITEIKVGNLYYGGCSLRMHLAHASNDEAVYQYYLNEGCGWSITNDFSIRMALESDEWDIIGIFSGTHDGSRHSSSESYEPLPKLIDYVRSFAPTAKLVYNLTWLSDNEEPKKELALYNGDQELVMSMIVDRIREHVISTGAFWRIVPAGAAVQNARNAAIHITRDGYHLSYGFGRFVGALTVIGTITDADISKVTWMPEGVTEAERDQAIQFAQKAILDPYHFVKTMEN